MEILHHPGALRKIFLQGTLKLLCCYVWENSTKLASVLLSSWLMYQAFKFFLLQTPSLIFNEHHIFCCFRFPFLNMEKTPSHWNLLYLEQKYLARPFFLPPSSTINHNEQNPVVVWGLPVEWPCCSLGVLPKQHNDMILQALNARSGWDLMAGDISPTTIPSAVISLHRCHWRSVPVKGSEWFVFTFDTQTFTWRWKFARTAPWWNTIIFNSAAASGSVS